MDDPGKVNRLPDVPTVSDFDLSEWLGDRVGDSIDWLFFGYDIPNFIVVYLAAIGLILMIKYFNRLDALKEAEKELQILARLKEIDPDLVEEARVVATFPHLTGRVSVGDFDEEEYNFLFSPEKAMRAESI